MTLILTIMNCEHIQSVSAPVQNVLKALYRFAIRWQKKMQLFWGLLMCSYVSDGIYSWDGLAAPPEPFVAYQGL